MKVTLADGRQMVGQMLAFDKVLSKTTQLLSVMLTILST